MAGGWFAAGGGNDALALKAGRAKFFCDRGGGFGLTGCGAVGRCWRAAGMPTASDEDDDETRSSLADARHPGILSAR
jgi:hypothetical protein